MGTFRSVPRELNYRTVCCIYRPAATVPLCPLDTSSTVCNPCNSPLPQASPGCWTRWTPPYRYCYLWPRSRSWRRCWAYPWPPPTAYWRASACQRVGLPVPYPRCCRVLPGGASRLAELQLPRIRWCSGALRVSTGPYPEQHLLKMVR